MKEISTYAIIMLFALSPVLIQAQTAAEKKILATLGPGETIANGENCFMLDKNPESVSFVTVTGSGSAKEYFCYGTDGKKTGPVRQPDISYWAACKDIPFDDCMANKELKVENPEEYIDFSTGSVKFQGKSYGPYGQVMMLYLSGDGQSFCAVALTMEMEILFFDKNNRKVELTGLPEQVMFSDDGSRAYALVKGSINPFDPEAAQKMMSNPEEMNNPKINLIGIDGSKYGPYTSDSFSDAWFLPSGQLIIYNNHEISVDGKMLFKSEDYISKCDIWISGNGKDYAWANYDHLLFSDGSKYTAPLTIRYTVSGGKGMLKWISLEEGKNLVLFKRPF